jgi:hypothetical protein
MYMELPETLYRPKDKAEFVLDSRTGLYYMKESQMNSPYGYTFEKLVYDCKFTDQKI